MACVSNVVMQDRSAFHFAGCTVVLNWYKGGGCFYAASSVPSLVLKLPLRGNANYGLITIMLIQITTESLVLMLSSKFKVLIAFYCPTGVCQTLANCSQ